MVIVCVMSPESEETISTMLGVARSAKVIFFTREIAPPISVGVSVSGMTAEPYRTMSLCLIAMAPHLPLRRLYEAQRVKSRVPQLGRAARDDPVHPIIGRLPYLETRVYQLVRRAQGRCGSIIWSGTARRVVRRRRASRRRGSVVLKSRGRAGADRRPEGR